MVIELISTAFKSSAILHHLLSSPFFRSVKKKYSLLGCIVYYHLDTGLMLGWCSAYE